MDPFLSDVTESIEERLALLLWPKRTDDAVLDFLLVRSIPVLEACDPEKLDNADGPRLRFGRITCEAPFL
jgi:hypothetical protein